MSRGSFWPLNIASLILARIAFSKRSDHIFTESWEWFGFVFMDVVTARHQCGAQSRAAWERRSLAFLFQNRIVVFLEGV